MIRLALMFGASTLLISLKGATQLSFRTNPDSLPAFNATRFLPQNFYNHHLGFFCKKEEQLQKNIGLNLFIRLGSKNYVDYLEKKPNAVRP